MIRTALAFVTTGLALAPSVNAGTQTWFEVGDAGQNGIAAAQVVSGSGTLNEINGILAFEGNDVDVYQIMITDFTSFSAETAGPLDTMLWLFKADGTGQVANDDYSGISPLSRITNQGVFANGVYYIAVSTFNNQPQDAGGAFSFTATSWPGPDTNQLQPNGAAGPFEQWTGDLDPGGGYQIFFTGASFVPSPGALPLLAVAALVGGRRRNT